LDVVVLDDHRMVGQAIAGLLSEVAGLHVTGVYASLAEAEALMHAQPPRLLVLDVELGGEPYRDAADLLLRLRPEAELMFVTALAGEFTPPADLAPFTVGVVDKADAWDQLLDVVLAWKRKRQEEVAAYMPSCGQLLEGIERLSPREQRLLRELGCGLLNKEIAARLELSVSTVETYRKSVAAKLGVSGSELVRLATLYRAFSWDASPPAAT
jgi:DNA-binding NarL/FixJ family response regulator